MGAALAGCFEINVGPGRVDFGGISAKSKLQPRYQTIFSCGQLKV